jgi:tetratricopeptide (TPR) repeat protein
MKWSLFVVIILVLGSFCMIESNYAEEYSNDGFKLIEAGNYKEAVDFFEAATYRDSKNATAFYGLGLTYFKLGNNETMTVFNLVEKATLAFKKALSLGANDPKIHYNLGLSYLALENKAAAIKEYDILKNLDQEIANQLLSKIDNYIKSHENTGKGFINITPYKYSGRQYFPEYYSTRHSASSDTETATGLHYKTSRSNFVPSGTTTMSPVTRSIVDRSNFVPSGTTTMSPVTRSIVDR